MGEAEARGLVETAWSAIVRGDVKAAFAIMSDDVSWSIPGALPGISGLKVGKAQIIDVLRRIAKTFPSGLTSDVRRLYADGDAVIIEVTNRGTSASGRRVPPHAGRRRRRPLAREP